MDRTLEKVPTKSERILEILTSSPISNVVRFSWWPPAESAQECDIKNSDVFSFSEGPIIFYLESGEAVGVSSDESIHSIVVWLERDKDGNTHEYDVEKDSELFPVSIDDKTYNNRFFGGISGKKIVNIEVIKRKPRSPKYEELPNEVGLKLYLSNNEIIILGHQLCGMASNFSFSNTSDLDKGILTELSFKKC